jgi:hypothetical protein
MIMLSSLATMEGNVCHSIVRAIKAFDGSAAPDENDEGVIYECRQ